MESLLQEIPVSPLVQTLIGLAGIVVATVLASLLLRLVAFRIIGSLTHKTSTTLDDQLLKVSRGYLSLLIAIIGLSVLFEFLQGRYPQYLGEETGKIVDGGIYGVGVFVVAILLVKVVTTVLQWYGREVADRTETSFAPCHRDCFSVVHRRRGQRRHLSAI